jgi:ribosome-binding protein aMBF1 (putative translation factor)
MTKECEICGDEFEIGDGDSEESVCDSCIEADADDGEDDAYADDEYDDPNANGA